MSHGMHAGTGAPTFAEEYATVKDLLKAPIYQWLDRYGQLFSYKPDDSSAATLLGFILERRSEYRAEWLRRLGAAGIEPICSEPGDHRSPERALETHKLLESGSPVLLDGLLACDRRKLLTTPDLIVRRSWLASRDCVEIPPGADGNPDGYDVIAVAYTQRPDNSVVISVAVAAQIVAKITGTEARGWILCRNFTFQAVAAPENLDANLSERRQVRNEIEHEFDPGRFKFTECTNDPVRRQRTDCRPGQCPKLRLPADDRQGWDDTIAWLKRDGAGAQRIYQISERREPELSEAGFPIDACGTVSLATIQATDPGQIVWTAINGIGPDFGLRLQTIHRANYEGRPIVPEAVVPPPRPVELFVDIETFSNLNDRYRASGIEAGFPMVFMIGVAWEFDGQVGFQSLVAPEESPTGQAALLREFTDWLAHSPFSDRLVDGSIFHWSGDVARNLLNVEAVAPRVPGDRIDLEKRLHAGPVGIPGAWSYSLKEVAPAIGRLRPDLAVTWPDELKDGAGAMVVGWHAYAQPNGPETREMRLLERYLEADCRAMRSVVQWLRSEASGTIDGMPRGG